eukprot:4058333-Ditylum_brightwellii.AAC.1
MKWAAASEEGERWGVNGVSEAVVAEIIGSFVKLLFCIDLEFLVGCDSYINAHYATFTLGCNVKRPH